MRRTYRPKKDTVGSLDHRDVLLTKDDKSSAFEAYYIQNIKQTKRELSSVGYSNHHGVASNKVRKRKYVKRIHKEIEPIATESLHGSVFLTPDKSIHVKKVLDPFDLLLNSSPVALEPKQAKKDDLFDLLVDRPSKQYTRKKVSKKKYNYSTSDNSDSEKENIKKDNENDTQNVTDIRTHEFVIEKEPILSPKFDESVNNMVKKLAVFQNLHHGSSNSSIEMDFKTNKNITENMESPIFHNSPISSTPFTDKHRSKSIYKFSPISISEFKDSPNYITIMEDESIKFDKRTNKLKGSHNNDIVSSPISHMLKSVMTTTTSKSLFSSVDKEAQPSLPNTESCKTEDIKPIEALNNNENSNIAISSIQTSEAEPFLGFPIDTIAADTETEQLFNEVKDDSIVFVVKNIKRSKESSNLKAKEFETKQVYENGNFSKKDSLIAMGECTILSEPFLGFTKDKSDNDVNSENENVNDSVPAEENTTREDNTSESEMFDVNSFNSCDDKDCAGQEEVGKVPIVQIERMNNSLFQKYYTQMGNNESTDEDLLEDSLDEFSEDASFYSLGVSEKSVDVDEKDNCFDAKENEEYERRSYNERDLTKDEVSCVSIYEETETNISDSSLLKEDNDDDKCISFVTTRRRNEITNNATILVLDDSDDSPSTSDCDKTVLSNNCKDNLEENSNNYLENVSNIINMEEISQEDMTVNNEVLIEQGKNIPRTSIIQDIKPIESLNIRQSNIENTRSTEFEGPGIVLQPGKKWERSLSIYRRMTMMSDHFDQSVLEEEDLHSKGRKYRQSVINTMGMQESFGLLHNESIISRRSTIASKPGRSTIRIVKETDDSRISISNTSLFDDLKGFLEDCDDTVVELSKLSIADSGHEVTVLEKLHESHRVTTAKDYVLRRCNQTDTIVFDECYPDALLKNCRKIGEGVYGEVYLWRAPDGRARVMKIVPIAGDTRVNGEHQKDFHEIISEIVIAMELSALRAPIAQIECHFDEGKDVDALDLHSVENATDVFNEVLAVRSVFGSYPSRLLDLWELYDETKGSENDNPAILPVDQQFIVLELANAGQDLESYQFNSAEQAHALFYQVAFALAVGEEAFQFEHRDLHWGNVLIAPTDQRYATFVLRGRAHRVPRRGVSATIIDYSLSRLSLPLSREAAALYAELAHDEALFGAVGDYQFEVYRLMRDKLRNEWKNFEPYTNILWLHYTADKMITALRYKKTTTKIHKQYIAKLKGIKERILSYGSAAQFVLTDNEY